MIFLVPVASAFVAGLFLDDMAEVVERDHYPDEPVGRALPLWKSVPLSLRFMAVVLPRQPRRAGAAAGAGRQRRRLPPRQRLSPRARIFRSRGAALHPKRDVDALRARHRPRIYLAGLAIAGFVAVPVLNLLTPLFATALMVHVHKRIIRKERRKLVASVPA